MSLLLTENDIPHIYNESVESKLQEGNVLVTKGALSSGFESYDLNLLVISSEDFFNNERKKRKLSKSFKEGEKVVFADLKIGDYVVHFDYGIGIYKGLQMLETSGIKRFL